MGENKDLDLDLVLFILAFHDLDNIQIELSTSYKDHSKLLGTMKGIFYV